MRYIAVLSLVAVLLLTTTSASALTGVAKFRQTEIHYTLTGHGAGRIEVWRSRIYTLKGKLAGSNITSCIFPDNYTSVRICISSYRLPLGRVFSIGTIVTRYAYRAQVFTGSDFYSNVRGTVITRRYGVNPNQSWLTFYFT